ncbi:hypothetical protein ACI782_05240 [Geodermatophilus sp. SYSU D00703]
MTSAPATSAERRFLQWSAALLLCGLVLDAAVTTLFHPTADGDVPTAVLAAYAASDAYEWIHLGQLVGVLTSLGGLFVLHRALRSRAPDLSAFAAGLTLATALAWIGLQTVDGVLLKQAVDAWAASEGPQQAVRLTDAETVRLSEWGIRGYSRVLLGAALLLFGSAILTTRLLPGATGWVAVLAGLLSIAVGVDVSWHGLDSAFHQVALPAFRVVLLVFAVGVTLAAVRRCGREPAVHR